MESEIEVSSSPSFADKEMEQSEESFSSKKSSSVSERSESSSSSEEVSSSSKSSENANVKNENAPKDEAENKVFVNPFKSGMEKQEKVLRLLIIFGFFPLPLLGWVIGLMYSLSIKNKKKIHKKLISILTLLSVVAILALIIILGYFFLIKKKEEGVTKKITVQKPGTFKPVVIGTYTKPDFKFDPPKLEYIPPKDLEEPIPDVKKEDDFAYEFFSYKHPSSKNDMLILLKYLDPSWSSHEMFRFSDYVDHNVTVVNVTKNEKNKTLTQMIEHLDKEFNFKASESLTIVAEFLPSELKEFEKLYDTLKVKRILGINPWLRCIQAKLDLTEFVGLYNEKIDCSLEKKDYPVLITEGGKVLYRVRQNKLTDLKSYFEVAAKDLCTEKEIKEASTKEKTREFLNKMFGPFRKFITFTTFEVKGTIYNDLFCKRV